MPEKTYIKQLSILGHIWQQREFSYVPRDDDVLSQLLAQRNITDSEKDFFLTPKLRDFLPKQLNLKGIHQGVEAVFSAIIENKKIVVFGDYDVDGATSSALLVRFFRQLGVAIEFYIPDREKEGYGPNQEALRTLHEQGTDLVITVDCGAVALDQLAYAKKIGLDVIVLDHHAGAEENPICIAHINPNRKDESNELTYLAAVGVTFLFCVEVVRYLKGRGYFDTRPEPDLLSLLDLVALGTVCDVVPLVGLNRAFVVQGLKVMSQTQNAGLKHLLQLLEINPSELSAYHLGFVVGPRINAGGRIGSSRLGTTLLSSNEESVVQKVAAELNLLNEERRQIQEVTFRDADFQVNLNDPAIVVSSEAWHLGVIGIVAGKLKEKYHKPIFVIAVDAQSGEGKASARSIPGFDIGGAIHAAHRAGVILQGGGHPMAGGFSLTHEQRPQFIAFIHKYIHEKLPLEDRMAKRFFDLALSVNSIKHDLVDTVERLAPFGASNPSPKFVLQKVFLSKVVVLKEKHIKCFLKDSLSKATIDGITFNAFDTELGSFLLKNQGEYVDIFAGVKRDFWQGNAKLTVYVEDARASL